ncbi:unnamed protein product [Cylicocyclus nassatus]|uniref:Uncharacterized protein n=1 Tax=Cylicocyclus nassatus TaxID=53992 RepID=A0AA36H6J1_CYLNA|nr:unnamed protein product [Cylicocyclus nassatus]
MFIKLYKRLVSTQEADNPMRLNILLLLVQIERALSQKSEKNEHICVNEEYTYHLHTYPCSVTFGQLSKAGSHAEQLQGHFYHDLNMTPSIPLVRVACAVSDGVKIPEKCGFMYYTTENRDRNTQMVNVIKSKLREAQRKGTIYFFFNCYSHGTKVTCAAKIEPWKGNMKPKCTSQKLNRKQQRTGEKQRRVSASTTGGDSPPPVSTQREVLHGSPVKDPPPPASPEEEEVLGGPPADGRETHKQSPLGDSTEEQDSSKHDPPSHDKEAGGPPPTAIGPDGPETDLLGSHESGPGPATRDGDASLGLSTSSEDP